MMRVVRDGESASKGGPKVNGVLLASTFLVFAGRLTVWGGWWWLLAVPLMALGVVGVDEETKR